jgi:HemY protein
VAMQLWLASLFAIMVLIIVVTLLRIIDNARNLLHRISYWQQKRKYFKTHENHEIALQLLKAVYFKQEKHEKFSKILPKLIRHHLLSETEAESLQVHIQSQALSSSLDPSKIWRGLNRQLRKQPELIIAYVKALIHLREHAHAREVIEEQLKRQWIDVLCEDYGKLETTDPEKQLKFMEKFLLKQAKNPILLATLGTLCKRLKIWGKAKTYYQQSLALNPSVDTYKHLGQLLEQLGESNEALKQYRAALATLSVNS